MTKRAVPVSLSSEQCQALEALGLIQEQIAALQRALPKAARQLQARPAMTSVRKVVSSLSDDIARARKSIEAILTARHAPDRREYLDAYERLAYRAHRPGEPISDGLELERALQALTALGAAIGLAADDGFGGQTRSAQGSHIPVLILHRAMADGWADANPNDPFMPAAFKHSRQTFSAVVAICYDAIRGVSGPEPEKAIKNYGSWLTQARTPARKNV